MDRPDWAAAPLTAPDWATEPVAAPETPKQTKRKLPEIFGPAEALRSMAGGFAAPVAGNVAGIAAMPLHAAGITQTDPMAVKERVQGALTPPPPSTMTGKALMWPAEMLGKGVNWAAGKAEGAIAPPPGAGGDPLSEARLAASRGTGELIRQAPGLAGAKIPKAASAVGEGMKGVGRDWMQSALKPGLTKRRRGQAEPAVETLLEEGINVSKGGVNKLRDQVMSLNDEIKERIAASPALIDKEGAAAYIKETTDKFMKQVDNTSDLRAIQNTYENFMDNPLFPKDVPAKTVETGVLDASGKMMTRTTPGKKAEGIPVPLAQEVKTGTYRQLRGKYGELGSAEIEAQKSLARFVKDKIAAAVPEVSPLNTREGQLLNALDQVEARVLQSANKNPIGLGILAMDAKRFAVWMADRSDMFKSIVARMLYSAGNRMPGPIGAAGMPIGMGIAGQAQPPQRPPL